MKKTKVFKRLIVSALALSMVLGSFCMTFAEEQSDKPADNSKAELVVSEIGYDEIAGMYEDTIVAQKDGKWGIAKFDGTELVPFEYDSIIGMDKDTFLAKKGDKWGMVKSDGTVLVPFEYDGYSSYDTNDGVVVLGKFIQSSYYGGLYDYYAFDKSGKELYYASHNGDEKEWSVNNLIYYNGLYKFSYGIPFTDNNKETYTDSKGNTILKVQWNLSLDANVKSNYKSTNLSPYGYAVAYPSDILFKDNENAPFIYLVSKDGCKELNVDINGVAPLLTNGESVFCYDNEGFYVLNISTNKLVKIYEYIGDTQLENIRCGFSGDILYVEDNGIYSLFDANGKAITDKKYSYIESSYDVKKYYLVCEDDKYFYIDADGKEYGTEFKDVSNFVDGQAIVLNQDCQAYIIDENFNQISESISAEAVLTGNKNTYAIKKADGKYYPVYTKAADNSKAELVVSETGYDEIAGMYEDTIVAQKDGKWGIAKFDGTELVPFEYDSIIGMDKDTFLAKKGDKWGMVKFDGTVLVPFEYDGYSSYDKNDGVVVLKKIGGEYEGNDAYDCCAFDKNGNALYKADAFLYYGGNILGYQAYTAELKYYNGLYYHHVESVATQYIYSTYMNSKGDVILKSLPEEVYGDIYADAETTKIGYRSTSISGNGYAVAFVSYYNDSDSYSKPVYLVSKDGYKELNVDLKGTCPFFADSNIIFCYEDKMTEVLNADSQWKRFYYVLNINTNELVKIDELLIDSSYEGDTECGFCGDILYLKAKDENGNATYSLFDTNGKALTEKKYSYVDTGFNVKKYYLVSEDDKYFYVDATGKEYGTEFKDAGKFVDGQAIVLNQDGQAYIIDENFNQISESVSADVVTSFNKNAYTIKKADGKYYPVYMKSSVDTYTKELTESKEIISSADFASILAENATKDVVIKNADSVEFSFAKGTMAAVEGKTEYDFGTTIIRDYDKATGLSTEFTRDNFALQIIYNYSGKLPAKADIKFNVGSEFAGKTLYYYLCNDDKTYTLIQNVVVDTDGFVTVEQDHCSTYVLTSSELLSKPDTDTGKDTNTDKNNGDKPANEAPATGDATNYILYIILLVASLGAMLLAGSKIADRA